MKQSATYLYFLDLLKSEVFWEVMCHWVLRFFEMSRTALPMTQHCKSDDFNLHHHHCENLKYCNSWLVFCEKMLSRSRIWHCVSVWVVPDVSKALRSLKTLRTTHPVTQCHITENLTLQQRCCENLKYRRKWEVNGIVPLTSQVFCVSFCITPGRLCYISYLEINAHINEKPV